MRLRYASIAAGLFACAVVSLAPAAAPPAYAAAKPAQPAISAEAKTAIDEMGKSLSKSDFSFEVHTIRVYQDSNGQYLHIFHRMTVGVRRPDRLAVHVNGDDGRTELLYDGKSVAVAGIDKHKYALIRAPDNIEAMMKEVMGRLHVDFPLADLLTNAPSKSFLSGVTSGSEVNTVTIDGAPYRHLIFSQKGGIALEVWLEKNEQALPRRLIVTYYSLPGEPNFVAEFSNWNFSVHPADAEFVFRAPPGWEEVALKPVGSARGSKGGKR